MRRYSQDDEERIRAQTAVRAWTRHKLLDPAQSAALEAELRVDVRRTNEFLRAGLWIFTVVIVAASVLLMIEAFSLSRGTPIATANLVAALACVGLAELLAGRFRFYRFGVEEALAVSAVFLVALGAAELTSGLSYGLFDPPATILSLLIGAAGAFAVYRRFGLVYAAVAGMACVALIPFQVNQLSGAWHHALAAAALVPALLVVRSKRLQYGDDFPGDEYGQLQASALAGVYLALNLQLTWETIAGPFYWFTYVMIWVLPIIGLAQGIREKDRALMDVSVVMALVTLVTNKPYLGWPRHTWDPILLGAFLITLALVLRRWLSKGPDGARHGFTAASVLTENSKVLTLLRTASTGIQPHAPASSSVPSDASSFDGGRSGGGGGGASY